MDCLDFPERFSVAEWRDGVSVFDRLTGDTHALDWASYDLFLLSSQHSVDDCFDAKMVACLSHRMSCSNEELLVFGRDLLAKMVQLGLINPGPDNCQP